MAPGEILERIQEYATTLASLSEYHAQREDNPIRQFDQGRAVAYRSIVQEIARLTDTQEVF